MLDYETDLLSDGKAPKTKFVGFANHSRYYYFGSTSCLRRFLRRSSQRYQLLHHSNFEVLQLLQDKADIRIQRSHKARIISCKFGKHTMLNTYSVFPVALEKILNAFGYKKESLSNLRARNWSDCVRGLECVERLADRFKEICGVNPLDVGTIAGTGLRACELVAGKMPIEDRFEAAYRGGRVEGFRFGSYLTLDQQRALIQDTRRRQAWINAHPDFECTQPERDLLLPYQEDFKRVSRFDINSSYPFSILDCPQRAKLLHVWVRVKDFHCPFFVEAIKEKLVFANGVFSTWIFEDTFERYIRPNCESIVFRIISQHELDFSWLCKLKPLIKRVYDEKRIADKRNDAATRECCKLFLNSIYGRFGLRGQHEMAIITNRVASGDCVVYHRLRNRRFLSFKEVSRMVRHNFAFASYIADNARARLYEGFVKTSAIYGDTDSVITTNGANGLDVGKGCGEWKRELTRIPFELRGLKDYTVGGKEVLKGGKESFTWTLKQFCGEGTVKLNSRTRGEPFHKRVVLADGTTRPHIVRV
jgi:hypothetical protein